MFSHLLILVCKIFSCLFRSEVFEEPDEKEIDGTHLHYTKFLLCILIAALMGISEKVSRSEMSYDLGGLSQPNLWHTIPLISIEVGQERFTRRAGSEWAGVSGSWLLQNAPYTSVLKFNSRACEVPCCLHFPRGGKKMWACTMLPKRPQQELTTHRKGPGRQLVWITRAPLISAELCRLALLKTA